MIEQISDDIVVIKTPDKIEYEVRVVISVLTECARSAPSCWDKTRIKTKLFIAVQDLARDVARPDQKILILDVLKFYCFCFYYLNYYRFKKLAKNMKIVEILGKENGHSIFCFCHIF